MSIQDLIVTGWRGVWANLLNPGSLMLFATLLIFALLIGIIAGRSMGYLRYAIRAGALIILILICYGFLGALGLHLTGLAPLWNWLCDLVQAPFIIPEG